ncbi:MAG: hypothetical protein HRU77_09825 [Gammaproteobacteria bacterium]|nr:MAG: hypothetical protein HRU77_09825 [Gammaproteobacteria bacterium]
MTSKWFLDWKDPLSYEKFNAKTSYEVFAWEFLRRNSQYQKDFDENKGLIKNGQVCFGKRKLFETMCGTDICIKEDMRTRYGVTDDSPNLDYRIDTCPIFDCLNYPSFSVPYETENEIKHNTTIRKNSKKKNIQEDHHQLEQKKKTFYVDIFDLPEEEPQPSEFNVHMSTDYDLKRQIASIRKFFKAHQKNYSCNNNHDKTTYRIGLRILDALAKNATKSEMYSIFDYEKEKKKKEKKKTIEGTDESTLNRHILLAKKLRDGDYIKIVRSKLQFPLAN